MKSIELTEDQAEILKGLVGQEIDDHERAMWQQSEGTPESGPMPPPRKMIDYRDELIELRDVLA